MGLWTPEHAKTLIPAIGVMAVLAWLFRRLLGKKELKTRMLPLQVIACLLVLLEIGKQGVSLYRGYDLYHLPFHFCSLFIFALPIMAFYRGKHLHGVYEVVSSLCASLFLLMLIYPNLIYSAWDIENYFRDYMAFHTVTFHNLVMLATVLILALDIRAGKGSACKAILIATGLFCAVSATMAQLLKTNYANFYSCNIPAFEALRTGLQGLIGPVLTQLLYVAVVALLTVLFVLMAYGLVRLARKMFSLREKQTV